MVHLGDSNSDRSARSRVLYPAELLYANGGEAGIRTPDAALTAYPSLAGERLQPLGYTTRLLRVRASEELVLLHRRCVAQYYFLGLISRKQFFQSFYRLHTSRSLVCKAKRVFYQQII